MALIETKKLIEKHIKEMEDWAFGYRSYTNGPFTPGQVAIMDVQEVIKHSVAIQALTTIKDRYVVVKNEEKI